MKKQLVKISVILLLVISVGLVGFFGYNEYIYQKISRCFCENNYSLAELYAESISPSFKDVKKVKTLLETVNAFDENDAVSCQRTFSRLESLKGFKNESINLAYNSFYFKVFSAMNSKAQEEKSKAQTVAQIASFIKDGSEKSDTHQKAEAVTSQTSQTETTKEQETVTVTNPETKPETETESTTVAEASAVSQAQAVVYAINEETSLSVTHSENISGNSVTGETVYYVESGEVYHLYSSCRSLSRSASVLSGTIPEGRRICKICQATSQTDTTTDENA